MDVISIRSAALLAVVALTAPGCKRGGSRGKDAGSYDDAAAAVAPPARREPETAVITEVLIKRVDPKRPVELDDKELATVIGSEVAGSKAFAAREEDVATGRTGVPARIAVTITYDLVDAPKGRAIVCAVEAVLEWKRSGRLTARENVLVERPLARKDEKQADDRVREVLVQAAMAAARGLVAKEELRQGDDAAVLAGLAAKDPDAVIWSLELVAERQLKVGFERSMAHLESRDPGVRGAALRALVALRDPRAVAPLAKMADFSSLEELRIVIEAVSAIGGDEATAFLEQVAAGHSDPDLRARAEEGLERLGRKRPQPGP